MPSPSRMRVLITDAGGFVGRHLIAALATLPDKPDIVAGTYGESASGILNARGVSLDVTDAERTFTVIQAEQPTHVMHLAGILVVSHAKITNAVARIHLDRQQWLEIGNLEARRDWGFAKEYTDGTTLIMDYHEPETFVLATGRSAGVRDFVEMAFAVVRVELQWRGRGVDEEGVCRKTGTVRVKVNAAFSVSPRSMR